jgi:hypothetical protein
LTFDLRLKLINGNQMPDTIDHTPDLGGIIMFHGMVQSPQTQGFNGQALRWFATERTPYQFDSDFVHA